MLAYGHYRRLSSMVSITSWSRWNGIRSYAGLGGQDDSEEAQVMFEFQLGRTQQQRVGPSP